MKRESSSPLSSLRPFSTTTVETLDSSLDGLVKEATVVNWVKHPGEAVKEGETVAVVEANPVTTLDIPAKHSGVIVEEMINECDEVRLGESLYSINVQSAEACASDTRTNPPTGNKDNNKDFHPAYMDDISGMTTPHNLLSSNAPGAIIDIALSRKEGEKNAKKTGGGGERRIAHGGNVEETPAPTPPTSKDDTPRPPLQDVPTLWSTSLGHDYCDAVDESDVAEMHKPAPHDDENDTSNPRDAQPSPHAAANTTAATSATAASAAISATTTSQSAPQRHRQYHTADENIQGVRKFNSPTDQSSPSAVPLSTDVEEALVVDVPYLGDANVRTAEVGEWRFKEGDHVRFGDKVTTVETDEISVAVASLADGVITLIHAPSGSKVAVGQPLFDLKVDRPCPEGEFGDVAIVGGS